MSSDVKMSFPAQFQSRPLVIAPRYNWEGNQSREVIPNALFHLFNAAVRTQDILHGHSDGRQEADEKLKRIVSDIRELVIMHEGFPPILEVNISKVLDLAEKYKNVGSLDDRSLALSTRFYQYTEEKEHKIQIDAMTKEEVDAIIAPFEQCQEEQKKLHNLVCKEIDYYRDQHKHFLDNPIASGILNKTQNIAYALRKYHFTQEIDQALKQQALDQETNVAHWVRLVENWHTVCFYYNKTVVSLKIFNCVVAHVPLLQKMYSVAELLCKRCAALIDERDPKPEVLKQVKEEWQNLVAQQKEIFKELEKKFIEFSFLFKGFQATDPMFYGLCQNKTAFYPKELPNLFNEGNTFKEKINCILAPLALGWNQIIFKIIEIQQTIEQLTHYHEIFPLLPVLKNKLDGINSTLRTTRKEEKVKSKHQLSYDSAIRQRSELEKKFVATACAFLATFAKSGKEDEKAPDQDLFQKIDQMILDLKKETILIEPDLPDYGLLVLNDVFATHVLGNLKNLLNAHKINNCSKIAAWLSDRLSEFKQQKEIFDEEVALMTNALALKDYTDDDNFTEAYDFKTVHRVKVVVKTTVNAIAQSFSNPKP